MAGETEVPPFRLSTLRGISPVVIPSISQIPKAFTHRPPLVSREVYIWQTTGNIFNQINLKAKTGGSLHFVDNTNL